LICSCKTNVEKYKARREIEKYIEENEGNRVLVINKIEVFNLLLLLLLLLILNM
jgi:hypothetical protein